jgi:hypothetical protein
MWEAAGYLGMSEKTLWEVYGHHHPDFLKAASAAISRRIAAPKQSLVISLAEEKRKRAAGPEATENIGGGRSRSRTRLYSDIPCEQGKEQGSFQSWGYFRIRRPH